MATPEDLGSLPQASPEITLNIGEETYALNWRNTLLRKFLIGEGEYDHFLHRTPDGQGVFYFLSSEDGIKLMKQLEKLSFPVQIDPVLDDSTIERYTMSQVSGLEAEIKRELS